MKRIFNGLPIIVLLCSIICFSAACSSRKTEDSNLQITVLNVGKGDCILLTKDGSCVLIDAGYDDTSGEVISFLQKKNVEQLDYFIVTHYDKDHVGGAAAVAENISIGQIYLPDYEGESKYYTALMDVVEDRSLAAEKVSDNISFTLADVNYEIYASDVEYVPSDGNEEGNDNDVSLVIATYWNEDSYLFAGDIEEDGIESFLENGHGSFDVVKMPHHGRKESNTGDFIESTQPKIALITDSEDDPADDKVLNLLAEAGADVYRTSQCGTIVLTGAGTGEYNVTTE